MHHRDLQAWKSDRHRFPPFQYNYSNGVIHKKHGRRMFTIEEKESIMGFPIGFTSQAWKKRSDPIGPKILMIAECHCWGMYLDLIADWCLQSVPCSP